MKISKEEYTRYTLKEITALEADIDNIDGDILDLEAVKEIKRKDIEKLRNELDQLK